MALVVLLQELLTVGAMRSITPLMYKVWKFITPHIITEHTAEPAALRAPLIFLSPLVPSLFYSSSVADERTRSVVFVTHLKLLHVSRFGLSG